MKIALIGDIHGRVFQTLATVCEWQRQHGERLDFLLQVGDLGAYPNPNDELKNNRFILQDSTQLDFSRMLNAQDDLVADLRALRAQLASPIHFIRGNHEDFAWLKQVEMERQTTVTPVDPFDLFAYVSDGAVMEVGGWRVAVLGGIETGEIDERSIDEAMYRKLYAYRPGEIDLLVTHDAPYGISTNYHGETQGSAKISALIEQIQPRYLIAGHYHHLNGPRDYGRTTYLGLAVLVDLRRDGERRSVQAGSIAVIDTVTGELAIVTEDWLKSLDCNFDFHGYVAQLKQAT
ncbi:metallophosphoesterase family protein [Alicyclobacillus fodiniaquatilis]|uniref:Metallophosphoesterase n=1 Tax=Alicyclobacillus fodiniaquatilis TaxID=1661150 RepID=A0ABW4JEC9_9BACL